jgi:hypothetical protein
MRRITSLLVVLAAACGSGEPTHLPRAALLDPSTCGSCHPDHYAEWSGSMHAFASDDPVFRAMNARGQRETGGTLAGQCVACHAPMAVHEGATTDGLNLDTVPQSLHGVTCFFCHSVDAVNGTHDNPLALAADLVIRGPFGDAIANTGHASGYSTLHDRDQADSAKLCGSCHDIVVNGHAAIERTFAEWNDSVFAHANGATCGQCHMDQGRELVPVAEVDGAPNRERHSHMFPAIDTALISFPQQQEQQVAVQSFLDTTLQSALCVIDGGPAGSSIRVVLDNVAAGHSFPSGAAQDRRLWAEVIAYQGDQVIYQSGVVPDGASPVDAPDPDLWLLRDCMFDTTGAPVHMFWQANSVESNTLPAQATFDMTDPRFYKTHVVQSFPRTNFFAGKPDRVTLRLREQPIGLEVLRDLVASGDLDPAIAAAMPTLAIDLNGGQGDGPVLEWTLDAVNGMYFENGMFQVQCVTKSNLNVASDKVPAVDHMLCTP